MKKTEPKKGQTPKIAKLKKTKRPRRKCNSELRTREYLTHQEIEAVRKAARATGRYAD